MAAMAVIHAAAAALAPAAASISRRDALAIAQHRTHPTPDHALLRRRVAPRAPTLHPQGSPGGACARRQPDGYVGFRARPRHITGVWCHGVERAAFLGARVGRGAVGHRQPAQLVGGVLQPRDLARPLARPGGPVRLKPMECGARDRQHRHALRHPARLLDPAQHAPHEAGRARRARRARALARRPADRRRHRALAPHPTRRRRASTAWRSAATTRAATTASCRG